MTSLIFNLTLYSVFKVKLMKNNLIGYINKMICIELVDMRNICNNYYENHFFISNNAELKITTFFLDK